MTMRELREKYDDSFRNCPVWLMRYCLGASINHPVITMVDVAYVGALIDGIDSKQRSTAFDLEG